MLKKAHIILTHFTKNGCKILIKCTKELFSLETYDEFCFIHYFK